MSRTDGSLMASTGSQESSSVTGHEGKVSSSRWLKGDGQVDHMSILPPELQYCITNYLKPSEVRNCRLVSSNWKMMMDKLYAHDVVLDQSGGFRGKLDISIKSCTIVSLGKINCRPLFVNAAWKPTSVTIVLGINKWNFFEMNNNWNNVTQLDLNWRSMASNSMFTLIRTSRRSKQFFPQLTSLKIGVPNFFNSSSITTRNIILNGEFIFSQRFPQLRELSIEFSFNTSNGLLPDIMNFIRAHSGSIIILDIEMLALSYSLPTSHPTNNSTILLSEPHIPIADFGVVDETLINSIHYKFIPIPTVDMQAQFDEWRTFLEDTSPTGIRLSRIISEKIMNYPIRLIDYYNGMITQTSQFITVLELSNLTLFRRPVSTPLNAEIFGSLINLERLVLKRNPVIFETTFHPALQNSIEITHLGSLPLSLKHLVIQGFAGESQDLTTMTDTLINLESLDFTQDTTSIIPNLHSGFDLLAFEEIITHLQLQEVTVSLARFVRPTFCARFYHQFIASCNWTTIFCQTRLSGQNIPDKISMFKTFEPKNIILDLES